MDMLVSAKVQLMVLFRPLTGEDGGYMGSAAFHINRDTEQTFKEFFAGIFLEECLVFYRVA